MSSPPSLSNFPSDALMSDHAHHLINVFGFAPCALSLTTFATTTALPAPGDTLRLFPPLDPHSADLTSRHEETQAESKLCNIPYIAPFVDNDRNRLRRLDSGVIDVNFGAPTVFTSAKTSPAYGDCLERFPLYRWNASSPPYWIGAPEGSATSSNSDAMDLSSTSPVSAPDVTSKPSLPPKDTPSASQPGQQYRGDRSLFRDGPLTSFASNTTLPAPGDTFNLFPPLQKAQKKVTQKIAYEFGTPTNFGFKGVITG